MLVLVLVLTRARAVCECEINKSVLVFLALALEVGPIQAELARLAGSIPVPGRGGGGAGCPFVGDFGGVRLDFFFFGVLAVRACVVVVEDS